MDTTDEDVGYVMDWQHGHPLDFPELLHQHPEARLVLAGANLPSEYAEKLARMAYVDLLGPVADSADLYNRCRVIALPVFVRGGVPLKIVEALAREKAVVALPNSVEGLPVGDGYDLLVREESAFAAAISSLLSDGELCRRLGQNGRNTFLASWSLTHAEEQLRQLSVLMANSTEVVRG